MLCLEEQVLGNLLIDILLISWVGAVFLLAFPGELGLLILFSTNSGKFFATMDLNFDRK